MNQRPKTSQQGGIVRAAAMAKLRTAAVAPKRVVKDLGGVVLTRVRLQLVFWGRAWKGAPAVVPSALDVANAASVIVSGAYMSKLTQYRSVGAGFLEAPVTDDSSEPPLQFNTNTVGAFVHARIHAGGLPSPNSDGQTLYMVIMPTTCRFYDPASAEPPVGLHTFYTDEGGDRVHFGWVMNDGTLAGVSQILSHELVEACTDAEGDGFQVEPVNPTLWHEIGDVCEENVGTCGGVPVQSYYSQDDGTCVIPGAP